MSIQGAINRTILTAGAAKMAKDASTAKQGVAEAKQADQADALKYKQERRDFNRQRMVEQQRYEEERSNVRRMELANRKARTMKANKKKQRRNFLDYFNEMPNNLGGKLTDFFRPEQIREMANKAYPSSAQRRKIMNQADREKAFKRRKVDGYNLWLPAVALLV